MGRGGEVNQFMETLDRSLMDGWMGYTQESGHVSHLVGVQVTPQGTTGELLHEDVGH